MPGLSALEIDPQAAAQGYRERIVDPVRNRLPEAVVKGIEEQLSGACTTEIAAFDEFTALLLDSALTADFDHIVFDTAPTGHTIRLLQLPGAWSGFLEAGKGDASCLGPLAGLENNARNTAPPSRPWPTPSGLVWSWSRAPNRERCARSRARMQSWRPSACASSTWSSTACWRPRRANLGRAR